MRVPTISTEKLTKDQKADVVVIGAGITGAMVASQLSAGGFSLILLDRRGPLKGATSATTALLQYEIDQPLIKLRHQIGEPKLEKKLSALFPNLNPTAEFAWCGSFGASKTGLPTIGEIPGMKNCFSIMSFGGNGITYSSIAAELLTAHLSGQADPDADLFEF